MVEKRGIGDYIFDTANVIILFFIMIITLYPFTHVLSASLSEARLLDGYSGILLYPKGFSVQAYRLVFKNPNILSGYTNTIIILVAATSLNIVLTSMGAYIVSRNQFAIRRPLMLMIIFTMYFSGGMIPRYLLINNYLKLSNNLLALILPGAISGYNLIVMRTNFESIPVSLEESAKLDGANDFTVLFKIIIPLSKATIAVMVLFYGVAHWNAWFDAVLFIRERHLYPLQLILREILISNSTESMMGSVSGGEQFYMSENIKYATIMVATVPILLIYPFIQKYFVKGVMIGAVKG
jgi:putative aldouronate transport system permease protein